ncbi:uncharacterized protein [Amphiura filiformis]|uniref:uncharacterized protein n=1 Tax=Amphiura filiformis TaxID=82378 RepID=UPI003B212395
MSWREMICLVVFISVWTPTTRGQTTPAGPSYTCETNPNYNKCYCVLDSPTWDTDNWFLSRSYCRQQLNGELVDITSGADDTFITDLLVNAGRTSAWLGITDINSEGTFFPLSDPINGISYAPSWKPASINDANKNCAVISTSGYWEMVDCQNSPVIQTTMCVASTSGNTGCPLNAIAYGSKCYGVYTISIDDPDAGFAVGAAYSFCQGLAPTGNLVLPEDTAENNFVHRLAKLTEFDRFWLLIERGSGMYVEYGDPATNIPFENWDATAMSTFSDSIAAYNKFAMITDTGLWGYYTFNLKLGVICQFDQNLSGTLVTPVVQESCGTQTTTSSYSK